ncbi:MAG: hypothetical protein UT48_C0018G0002 [Parcubacteria group bacterium GW2011_GWE2_39_37]|uniref:Uncharacterized protein n=1 Tax=Candidatus Falkowbacteria bacterium GW2011_GWF2_39_8 TaxID=1618642 RepID=A0A0G0T6N1_9BACT|nr:MAG: hypothetical protein UT48_C0018G0002 [Parcubacteria group bacterium GW2011_GWE2_39_37]KKR33507.1 MAG: hypothetical protein UT64_C0007G0009 [Candidatus Falkowbacteria bacterium GW2011_GWF2_39_8]
MALKEATKKLIQKHIPGFDFSRERSVPEMRSVVKVANELAKKKLIAKKLEDLDSRGVRPGVIMENSAGERETVSSISSDGHIVFVGRRGGFHPAGWQVVK